MGKPMARNAAAGFPLVVWNRTQRKLTIWCAKAPRWRDPRERPRTDVLITIVSDPPALEEVLFGRKRREYRRARGSASRSDAD